MLYAFEDCDAIQKVLYLGWKTEWYKVECFSNEFEEKVTCLYTGPKPLTVDVSQRFTDVSKDTWYYNAVNFVYNNELFMGTSKTTFAPSSSMTRAMFVTVLGRLSGVQDRGKILVRFKDVPSGKWYSAYVAWAEEAGISDGITPDTFEPDLPITREQICKMMVKYCNGRIDVSLKNIHKPVTFKDAGQISGWAKGYVATCQRAGLVGGSDGYFKPKDNATRAEVAKILMNFEQNYHVID